MHKESQRNTGSLIWWASVRPNWTPVRDRPGCIGWRAKGKSRRLYRDISRLTDREWLWLDEKTQVARLNRMMVGWANYFCLGRVRQAYRNVNYHAMKRLRQWLCRKHKVRGQRGTSRFSDQYLHEQLGLVNIEMLAPTRNRLWANA